MCIRLIGLLIDLEVITLKTYVATVSERRDRDVSFAIELPDGSDPQKAIDQVRLDYESGALSLDDCIPDWCKTNVAYTVSEWVPDD